MTPLTATLPMAGTSGYFGLFLATFVSEDLACIAAGLLVAQGQLDYLAATLACLLGIFAGDIGLYLIGRYAGHPALRHAPLRWVLTPERIDQASRLFARRGPAIILLSRFMPGTRVPAYFTAGLLKLPLRHFLAYFALGAAIWTPLLVGLSVVLGEVMLGYYAQYGLWAFPVFLGGVLLVYAVSHWLPPLFTWRGRRLAVGRWQRLTRWEYWPWWAIYPPILCYILYLGFFKHRQPRAVTAVNPAMPQGGLIGESKADILSGLQDTGEAIARWALIPDNSSLDNRVAAVEAFQNRAGLPYPIVLKPDQGERGSGVGICRDAEAIREHLSAHPEPMIAQEFIGGHEYGVFYVRLPGEACGKIMGITDKRLTQVVGDGQCTLETLILSDPRAVAMAPFFLKKHADKLETVPEAGQQISLAELGTHCRGALFLDGAELITAELTEAIDRISQSYTGFYFGRYDLKCAGPKALRAGKGLKVLEVNGLTSESTWMYDPRHSPFAAWRILAEQWRLAYAIGTANAGNGSPTASWRELLHAAKQFIREQ